MEIDYKNSIPIEEASKDFSKVLAMLENGTVVITEHNNPRYVFAELDQILLDELNEHLAG